ncbi:protein FAM221B [Ornithorhynchus anatinus]|uniref:protein FAM221B n=1 Tax=Ornithorhynchus anatinus TaxID=9258 RepID=UPI0010A8DBEC|nr:protein FAM221B [Ornithorhynchus anatinus]
METDEPSSSKVPEDSTDVEEADGTLGEEGASGVSAALPEEAEEEGEGMGINDHNAQMECQKPQRGKRPGKRLTPRYTAQPVVPAERAELVSVAQAMHREQFGARVNELFRWEKDAALKAIQTGLYIGWRCPHYLWDCFRIGDESKCFCGHLLREHQIHSDISVPCTVTPCRCLMFCFIPSRPEEVGEFWLRKRAGFDPAAWRAMCRCKHSHEEHSAMRTHRCQHGGCRCNFFESSFLCAACDRRWEEHDTFFETEENRRQGGRPYGADYLPFVEMPNLRNAVLTGHEGDSRAYMALLGQLTNPPSAPHSTP